MLGRKVEPGSFVSLLLAICALAFKVDIKHEWLGVSIILYRVSGEEYKNPFIFSFQNV